MGQRESVKKYLRNVSLIYVFFGFLAHPVQMQRHANRSVRKYVCD